MSAANGHSPDAQPTGTLRPQRPSPEADIPPATLSLQTGVPAPEPTIPADALRSRRDSLAAEVAHLQWDLGGLAYEMAVRDHFRLDVLVRAAARMQTADAELGEIDRILHLRSHGAAGTCGACGALRSQAASYCWSCGAELMPQVEVGA